MTDSEFLNAIRKVAIDSYNDGLKGLEYQSDSYSVQELARLTGHEYSERAEKIMTRLFDGMLYFNHLGLEGCSNETCI